MIKSKTHGQKQTRIDLRLEAKEKELLLSAALSQGKKLSEFVITASVEAAHSALANQNRFILTDAEMADFLTRLDADPQPLPALRELFTRKSVFE